MDAFGISAGLPLQQTGQIYHEVLSGDSYSDQNFWDYLYQLQLEAKLCDIQLCIREVGMMGDVVPVSHAVPAHKLVLTGCSRFFRRCLESGELLDMYNFDGIQPQNLQVLIGYMYHQISWDMLMANEEAAELARILEIMQHQPAALYPRQQPADEKNVLVLQMKDEKQKEELDEHSLSKVREAAIMGQGTSDPATKEMKKDTRVLIKNLQEEFRKHNIGQPRKKVLVLSSDFPDKEKTPYRTIRAVYNTTVDIEDVPIAEVTDLEAAPNANSEAMEATDTGTSETPEQATPTKKNEDDSAALEESNDTQITEAVQSQEQEISTMCSTEESVEQNPSQTAQEDNSNVETADVECSGTRIKFCEQKSVTEDLVEETGRTENEDDDDNESLISGGSSPRMNFCGDGTPLKQYPARKGTQSPATSEKANNSDNTSSATPRQAPNIPTEAAKLAQAGQSPYSTRFRGQKRVCTPPRRNKKARLDVVNSDPVEEGGSSESKESSATSPSQLTNTSSHDVNRDETAVDEASIDLDEKELLSVDGEQNMSPCQELGDATSQDVANIFDEDGELEDDSQEKLVPFVEIKPESSTMDEPVQDMSYATSTDEQFSTLKPKRRVGRPRKQDTVITAEDPFNKKYPFVCVLCNKRFKNQTGLNIHEHWKHNEQPAESKREGHFLQQCETCQKVCRSYQALVQHMRNKHSTVPNHHCDECNLFFTTLREFKSHRITQHGAIIYSCDICNISFKSREGHKIHMYKQHTEADNNHVCSVCGKSFKMKHELNSHMKITHAPERAFKCQLCTRDFKNKNSLKRHLKTFHTDVKSVPCPECFLLFKTKADMQAHCKKHFRSENPIPVGTKTSAVPFCGKCDKTFEKLSQLQAHDRTVHNGEPGVVYICTMCKKSYSAKNYLMQHIRQMHLPKRYKCPQCLYEFTHAYMLRKHLPKCKGSPINTKPYKCNGCNRYFNLKGNLTRHIRNTGRCRGATQKYADYIVVLSSNNKGIGEVREDGEIIHSEPITLEALQASEALQQLQASGSGQPQEDLSNILHIDVQEGGVLDSGEVIQESVEEVILDHEQVRMDVGSGNIVKEEVSEQSASGVVEGELTGIPKVIGLQQGLKTVNINKGVFSNVVFEMSGDSDNVVVTSDIQNISSSEATDSQTREAQMLPYQQYVQTSTGEVILQEVSDTVTQESSEETQASGGRLYYLKELIDEGAEVQMSSEEVASNLASQVFQVVQDGELQELVDSGQIIQGENGLEIIQNNTTIKLISTGDNGESNSIETGGSIEHVEAISEAVQEVMVKEEQV